MPVFDSNCLHRHPALRHRDFLRLGGAPPHLQHRPSAPRRPIVGSGERCKAAAKIYRAVTLRAIETGRLFTATAAKGRLPGTSHTVRTTDSI
jgi:hypothetical protein